MNTTLDDLLKKSQGLDAVEVENAENDVFPPEFGSLTGNPRTEARLLAMQALYQHLLVGTEMKHIRDDFSRSYVKSRDAENKLFRILVDDMAENVERYTELVAAHLAEGWSMERVGLVERCILITAASEFTCRLDTPYKVIINEFVNISKGYFKAEGVSFINAAVDKLARKIRPADIA